MHNDDNISGALRAAMFRILKSLAAIGLRFGMSAGAGEELLRRAWVEAATESLQEDGKRPMSSRICALTGLYRKEVVRLQSLPPVDSDDTKDRYNRSARVITGWLRDERFLTAKRKPAVLRLVGENSFQDLVKQYSGDMTANAMLEELLRTKSVELGKGKTVKLRDRGYIAPKSGTEALQILGDDTTDLVNTIAHNLDDDTQLKRFQRKVSYRHIPQQHVESFHEYATDQSQALLEKLDRWLARRDTENIAEGTPGSRLGLGIYLIAQENRQENHPSGDSEK